MFNLGIAAGSLLGVPSVDALGLRANLWLAAACMLLPAGALCWWRQQTMRAREAGSVFRLPCPAFALRAAVASGLLHGAGRHS
ncbi:hypothetical protein G6F66_014714 [Rhizopus arrhizus]|nr:hypothetical protein G6F66_014714 [Rhizopus arrhizus]